jgi:hypothetical protein
VQESWNLKKSWFQPVESIQLFQLTFGFVWNCLETFDLDGHNLGTVKQSLLSDKHILVTVPVVPIK